MAVSTRTMTAHESLFFAFPLSQESHYGFCNYNGMSIVPMTIAFNMSEPEIRKNFPQPNEITTTRIEKIVSTITDLAKTAKIDAPASVKPVDHGKKGVTYKLDEHHLVRLQKGRLEERPHDQEWLLPSKAYKYDPDLDVTFEILTHENVGNASEQAIQKVVQEASAKGFAIWDQAKQNFTTREDGRTVLVDPDAYCPKMR